MSENIKVTIKTLGWGEIKQIFKDEIINNSNDIRTNGKDYKTIAVETIAKKEARQIVKKVLNKIEAMGNEVKINKQSFK